MVGARARDSGRDRIRVADRLDLLDPVAVGEVVEVREETVEQADDLGGLQTAAERREIDDVGEEDARRLELVGNRLAVALQPLDDLVREDVEEKLLDALLSGAPRCLAKVTRRMKEISETAPMFRAPKARTTSSGSATGVERTRGASGTLAAEDPVERAPERAGRQNHQRDRHEERLPQRLLGGVVRVAADSRRQPEEADHPARQRHV
jgi:hypothetical protein